MRNVALTLWIVLVGLAQGRNAVTLSAQSVAQVSNRTGILLANAPMFLFPDAGRTPLATLPSGTTVRLVGTEGDWYKIINRDSLLGDRTGYIRAVSLRVDGSAVPRAPAGETGGTPVAVAPQTTTQRAPARPASPRKASSWSNRGYVSLNGTYQTTSNAFTATSTFTQNVETASVTTSYESARSLGLDVGGAVRVWRNLGVGAAVTWFSRERNANLSASIPHPFLFNTPRTVSGSVADVPRREVALHLNASWVVPAGKKTQIAIFGGPSYFQVRQGLVTDVTTSSVYPYDTATFVSATTVQLSQSHLGFNTGVDITARVSKAVGVGPIVRYSRASLHFPVSAGQEVEIRAGGLQVGGGVRFAF